MYMLYKQDLALNNLQVLKTNERVDNQYNQPIKHVYLIYMYI